MACKVKWTEKIPPRPALNEWSVIGNDNRKNPGAKGIYTKTLLS